MRDLAFVLVLPLILFAAWQRPFIALGLNMWTTLIFPNGWMYGFATSLRINLILAFIMFATYARSDRKKKFEFDSIMGVLTLFAVWFTITSVFALHDSAIVWDYWFRVIKVLVPVYFAVLIIEKKIHFDFMLWCILFSVGFFAVVEGLKWIASGGGHAIVGLPTHSLQDRNELSIAFSMTIPVALYLRNQYGAQSKVVTLGLLGVVLMLVLSILGTNSRGGFVALLALAAYLFKKSKHKLLLLMLGGLCTAVAMQFLSDKWFDRMNTIQKADGDSSFMGRVIAWKLTTIMVTERPIFGGGFKAIENTPNWNMLAMRWDEFSWFDTGDAYPGPVARAAHSVYFQLLGDHGPIGLLIYISIIALCFVKNGYVIKQGRKIGAPPWMMDAAVVLQLSLFVFCVGGLTLSFAYFDMVYMLFALSAILHGTIFAEYEASYKRQRRFGGA
jgi:probable O-glycosylation ligase (exosortase A-associated)